MLEPWVGCIRAEEPDDRESLFPGSVIKEGDGTHCDRCGHTITILDWDEDWGYNGLCNRCQVEVFLVKAGENIILLNPFVVLKRR